MANKERLLLLADHVEKAIDLEFNMQKHNTCLIGFTQHLFPDDFELGVSREARNALELTDQESGHLFFPKRPKEWDPTHDLHSITREQAVEAVRRFAETGVIDFWPH